MHLLRRRWGSDLEEVLASPASCFSALIVVMEVIRLEGLLWGICPCKWVVEMGVRDKMGRKGARLVEW